MFWYVFKTCLTIAKNFFELLFIKWKNFFKLTKLNFLTRIFVLFFNMQRYVLFSFFVQLIVTRLSNWKRSFFRLRLMKNEFNMLNWKNVCDFFFHRSFRSCNSNLFLIEILRCCCFVLFNFKIVSTTNSYVLILINSNTWRFVVLQCSNQ